MSGGNVLFRLNHTHSISWNNQFKTHKSILRFLFCPQQTIIILVIMKITCTKQSSARTQCPASSTTKFTEGAGAYPPHRWLSSLGMHMMLTANERRGRGFVKCILNTQLQGMSQLEHYFHCIFITFYLISLE